MRQIRAYYAQLLNAMISQSFGARGAYALFDMDGCMLRLNGTEGTLRFLERKGIGLGTIWDFDRVGVNAVSVGLREMRALCSVGKENRQRILEDVAVYFAPLCVGTGASAIRVGGIGILLPEAEQNELYLTSASGIATDLMIRMSMAFRTSASYDDVDAKGMVLLDINRKNGSVTITHHNRNFFDILGLPRESYRKVYFKPAEEYFDPRPANGIFWDMVEGLEKAENREVTLSVRGKQVECIVTTKPHREDNIGTKGTLLYITTKRQISRQISGKANNSAILTSEDIIGQSSAIKSQVQKSRLLAHTDSNVMILGESGTGKEVFAQAIHNMSDRRDKPFIAVNCGALPKDLIESELFGYESGAFTGSKKQGNIGKFELADGGTLFLDEIGELPLDLQATLLRAVELKRFMRIGGQQTIYTDVKIISATNADIRRMINERKFRADLYYRLGTMQLFLPPLRERGEDVILLAEHFSNQISRRIGRQEVSFSEDAKQFLRACPWQGNVRELQNLMECVIQLYPDTVITREHLLENADPSYSDRPVIALTFPAAPQRVPEPELKPADSGSADWRVTREQLIAALEESGNNRSKAARILGVGRKTLYRYLERYGIQ